MRILAPPQPACPLSSDIQPTTSRPPHPAQLRHNPTEVLPSDLENGMFHELLLVPKVQDSVPEVEALAQVSGEQSVTTFSIQATSNMSAMSA